LSNETTRITWNGEARDVTTDKAGVTEIAPGHFLVRTGEETQEVFEVGGALSNGLTLDSVEISVETARERIIRERFQSSTASAATKTGMHVVKAPMPGLVRAVHTAIDDVVERATTLLVLEAMKMENNIAAGVVGKVVKVLVEQGRSVEKNSPLVEIEFS
jgi:biotin carboxyl carrier protein